MCYTFFTRNSINKIRQDLIYTYIYQIYYFVKNVTLNKLLLLFENYSITFYFKHLYIRHIYQNLTLDLSIPIKIQHKYLDSTLMFSCLLTRIPKITIEGIFYINSIKRVFISKLVKSSNLYFKQEVINNNQIITNKICMLNKLNIYIVYQCNQKIFKILYNNTHYNFTEMLYCLGLINRNITILSRYGRNYYFINTIYKSRYKRNKLNNLIITKFIKIIYMEYITLHLIKNKRFTIKLSFINLYNCVIKYIYLIKLLFITHIIEIIDIILDYSNNKILLPSEEHLSYKSFHNISDFIIQNVESNIEQFFHNLYKLVYNKYKYDTKNLDKFFNKCFHIGYIRFKELLGLSPLIQYLIETNSLSILMHSFKILSSGYIKNKLAISLVNRDINLNYIGRICILNTSESMLCGLINSLTISTCRNNLDLLTMPIYKYEVNNKKVDFIYFIDSIEQEINEINFVWLYKRKGIFFNTTKSIIMLYNMFKVYNLTNSTLFPKNFNVFISPAETLLPFLLYNDPIRCLMGSKMYAQALPLLYKQKAFIITGQEQLIYQYGYTNIISIQKGIVHYVSSSVIIIIDLFQRRIVYNIPNYIITNQNCLQQYYPVVWVGDIIVSGQLLAEGNDVKEYELSIGANLCVAYTSYLGYEYEDALIINEKVLYNHIYTSLHIKCYKIESKINTILLIEFLINKKYF